MKKVKLGEVCEIRIGKTPNRSQTLYWGGDYPWLSISDMKGKILCTTKEKITQEAVQKEKMQIVSKGTVVMSFKLSIGKVGILAENMYTNEAIANFVVKNNKMLFNEYLYYALQGMNFDSLTDRAVMGRTLNKAKLNNLSIVYNEPFMQQQIVLRLDGVNKLIESRKQQLSELSKLVKSRFNEMFGDPVFNEMRWRRCKLKDISIGKLAYGSGASAIDFSGLRYIRITDIDECGNLKLDKKSPSHYDEKYLLNTGDILFARSGATVGKTFLYSKEKYGPALYAGYLIRLIPNLSLVNPVFVYHFTNTKFYNDFIAKVQNTVAQPNINAKQYSELDFILPPLSLQNEFADFVAQVDKSQFACGIVIKLWRNNLKSSII